MVEAEDYHSLQSKRKAISALLPYAVWRERDGQPEMLDVILHAARASRMFRFMWCHVDQFVSTLFSEASPRAIALVSPYIPWDRLTDRGDLVQWWAETAPAVPHTEEIARSVVDTLLHIASWDELVRHIPVNLWSWLTERPSLPPICLGRSVGTHRRVVEVVRALKDIEVLNSYLSVVWSEWDTLGSYGFGEMCTIIREDFGGIGAGHHREGLIQRLDHVLEQLDRGVEYLNQWNHYLDEHDIQEMKDQYGSLRETLLETNIQVEANACTCYLMIMLLRIPTQVNIESRTAFTRVLPTRVHNFASGIHHITHSHPAYRFICTRL